MELSAALSDLSAAPHRAAACRLTAQPGQTRAKDFIGALAAAIGGPIDKRFLIYKACGTTPHPSELCQLLGDAAALPLADGSWRAHCFALPAGGAILLVAADPQTFTQAATDRLLTACVAALEGDNIPALVAGLNGNASQMPRAATPISDFWLEELKGAPAETGLYADKKRPLALTGQRVIAALELAGDGASSFADVTWVTTAFLSFLHRMGRADEVMAGVEIDGRPVPVRLRVDKTANFRRHLDSCDATIKRLGRQDCPPFAALAAALGLPTDRSRSPLAQVFVQVVHAQAPKSIPALSSFGFYDWHLQAHLTEGKTTLVLAAAADLFERPTVARYLRHFASFAQAAARDPEQLLTHLPLLAPAERRHILEDFNQTEVRFPTHETLHGLLAAQAQRTPTRTALIFDDAVLNYREFDDEANKLAHQLRAHGVGAGKMVGLFLDKSAELIISVFAILKAGAAYVPLDPAYPRERLRVMLDDAQVSHVVTTAQRRDHLPDCSAQIVDLAAERTAIAGQAASELSSESGSVTPQSLAYMIYTSGSTGKPKGVLVSHDTVVNFLYSMRKTLAYADDEITLSANTISFDIVIPDLFLTFMTGGTLVLAAKDAALDGTMVAELLQRYRVTNMLATPSTWQILLDSGWEGSRGLRIIAAGEALPPALAAALKGLGKSLWNAYGPTEVTVIATYYEVQDLDRPLYIGLPLDNVFIYILDDQGEPVPVGVPGELFIAGAGVTRGYWQRPELTAARFVPNPFSPRFGGRMYKTGDLGRFAPDGQIEYLGRNDDQVKVRGFRIELGDIESILVSLAGVAMAAVVVREDSPGDQRLVAYYTEENPGQLTAADLRLQAAAQLPAHMIPSQFVALASMPLNPNGKIARRALPAPVPAALPRGPRLDAPHSTTEAVLTRVWCEILHLQAVGRDDNFFESGGNSLLAVRMVGRLKKEHGLVIPVLKVFEFPTIAGLAAGALPGAGAVKKQEHVYKQQLIADDAPSTGDERKVAIIGLALRFPGAEGAAEFWRNISQGVESIDFWAPHEMDAGIDAKLLEDPHYVRARGIVRDGDKFDHNFFGISRREAEVMDPAQRLFLEIAWAALEDGGYTPDSYDGAIGVYAGAGTNTYFSEVVQRVPGLIDSVGAFTTMLANEKDYLTTRTAHRLNLKGPAINVQTACSTSLVAIHLAVRALRERACVLAIAGGSSSTSPPKSGYLYQEGSMLSPDGHTRSFDDKAQGTVFSDGVGAVLLKRLDDARRDGDRIIAVICGSALNNDGGTKASFTAPSVDGQAAVVAAALNDARAEPSSITYIEAHGTATPLGDPIELTALARAFAGTGRQAPEHAYCALGSLKSNVGHMVASAGVGGLIKTALALAAQKLPPTINFQSPTSKIAWDESPFYVNQSLRDWSSKHGVRRAGVSSFGVGGTNAHVVLEEAPPAQARAATARTAVMIPLSAKTAAALTALRQKMWRHLAEKAPVSAEELADLAFTLQVGRKPLPYRMTMVATDGAMLLSELGDERSPAVRRGQAPERAPDVVFLFPGQGVQCVGMGRGLYRAEPAYRAAFDACAAIVNEAIGVDLVAVLDLTSPADALSSSDRIALSATLNATAVAQPAIFATEYACAKTWMARGIVPQILIGHSIGELVAACIAGVMTLPAALRLVCERARLMQSMAAGSMLSVRLKPDHLAAVLPSAISIAAINSPQLCVVGGAPDAIASLQATFELKGIACKLLMTSHAFHTPMMAAAVTPLRAAAERIGLAPPQIPIISTALGRTLRADEATDPHYWAEQIRRPVLFTAALQSLGDGAARVFVECGPRQTLATLARQVLGEKANAWFAGTLAGDEGGRSDDQVFAESLATLWMQGVSIDWAAHYATERRQRLALPSYPFERTRVWPEVPAAARTINTNKFINTMEGSSMSRVAAAPKPAGVRRERLLAEVRDLLEEASGIAAQEASAETSFLDLGLDSLFLTQFALKLQRRYGLKVSFRQLLETYSSFAALVDHIDEQLPPDATPAVDAVALAPMPAAAAAPAFPAKTLVDLSHDTNGSAYANESSRHDSTVSQASAPAAVSWPVTPGLDQIVSQQLHIMARQLDLLSGRAMPAAQAPLMMTPVPVSAPQAAAAGPLPATPTQTTAAHAPKQIEVYDAKKAFGAAARITLHEGGITVTAKQKQNFDDFVRRYTGKTRESKRQTQFYRPWLADPRVVTGFRPAVKELIYQVIMDRSQGARLWDVDGNEYVDALCGFGMNFFGWSADFIMTAVRAQLDKGLEIGPQTPLAGEVAKLLCEMTGFDRAGFCNTGSEAVMGCMRIARTVTGRDKIVTFNGSYHGIFDEVIVRGLKSGKAIPAAPGIMAQTAENVVVLDYGSDEALNYIRANAGDLAAVLCEPIQSRRADLQPKDFLEKVRAITAAHGTALIFDEVITGFRLAPGGAQQYFGIKADLASYGKVIGGGFPIGIIAGKREWTDALDGGFWKFGDDSKPEVGVTYFAGTFVRHPPALAAAKAVLLHLKAEGPGLQQRMNARTAALAQELNAHFERAGLPLFAKHMGSLWRCSFTAEMAFGDLLFTWLRFKGLHIWDGFPCFLTTAHTDADLHFIVRCFKEAIAEMQAGDLLPGTSEALDSGVGMPPSVTRTGDKEPPVPGARLGRDPHGFPAWYVADPANPGKFLKVT